ncbi:MAG: pitrilysin family protein [candidate division WOR-3 bacterium]|uniref:Insulinase family protein n=1 Tax=candidate division WOR-3 bacterium TaxID=2052148 RepID=A0A7C4S261_UNCW3
MIQKEKINGVTLVLEHRPFYPSVALCVAFNHGSRDEPKEMNGISHFVEHMLFKGTKNKTAKEISYYAESIGCILDAFTGREMTGIYARFLKEFAEPVCDLLKEIICYPLFNSQEFEKEREVIIEEIKQSNEDDEDLLFNLFFNTLFPNASLGLPIAGKIETIKKFTPEIIKQFYWENYTKSKVVISVVGDLEKEVYQKMSENLLLKEGSENKREIIKEGGSLKISVKNKTDLDSVYFILGKKIFFQEEKEKYALSIFNTSLGGSLSSRLFQRLREEEGLVYQISSFVDFYEDVTIFGIYFVCDKAKLEKTLNIVTEELIKLKKEGFTKREYEIALNYTKSAIVIHLENPLNRSFNLAKNEFIYGRSFTVEEILDAYNQVKKEQLDLITEKVLSSLNEFSVASVGNVEESDVIKILPKEIY